MFAGEAGSGGNVGKQGYPGPKGQKGQDGQGLSGVSYVRWGRTRYEVWSNCVHRWVPSTERNWSFQSTRLWYMPFSIYHSCCFYKFAKKSCTCKINHFSFLYYSPTQTKAIFSRVPLDWSKVLTKRSFRAPLVDQARCNHSNLAQYARQNIPHKQGYLLNDIKKNRKMFRIWKKTTESEDRSKQVPGFHA